MIRPEQRTAREHMAAVMLGLAEKERDEGNEVAAISYETAADNLGATCPHCGGDLLGAFPVDGRDVDTPPMTAAELSRQSIKANAEKQQAAVAMGPGTPEELAVLKRFAEARRDRPSPADQIRRDEATRKELDNHEEN